MPGLVMAHRCSWVGRGTSQPTAGDQFRHRVSVRHVVPVSNSFDGGKSGLPKGRSFSRGRRDVVVAELTRDRTNRVRREVAVRRLVMADQAMLAMFAHRRDDAGPTARVWRDNDVLFHQAVMTRRPDNRAQAHAGSGTFEASAETRGSDRVSQGRSICFSTIRHCHSILAEQIERGHVRPAITLNGGPAASRTIFQGDIPRSRGVC